jgi:hypothetical protein
MILEAFGEYSLSRTVVFEWHSRFKAGRVSVEDDEASLEFNKEYAHCFFLDVKETVQCESVPPNTTVNSDF